MAEWPLSVPFFGVEYSEHLKRGLFISMSL